MSESTKEHNKKVILTYLKESGALYTSSNVIYASKAFIINSVLKWCLEKVDRGEMAATDLNFYLDSMNDFLDDKLKIYWNKDGNLVIGA
jgi:hypothetical protein